MYFHIQIFMKSKIQWENQNINILAVDLTTHLDLRLDP